MFDIFLIDGSSNIGIVYIDYLCTYHLNCEFMHDEMKYMAKKMKHRSIFLKFKKFVSDIKTWRG